MRADFALIANRARPVSRTKSRPAPIRGWNTLAPIAKMDERFAVQLDNWIPRENDCEVRGGQANYTTGITGEVLSLMPYTSPTVRQLFGAAASAIYNVTSSGAVGAAVVTGLGSANWESVIFTTTGGTSLMLVNGTDSLRRYDGASWTTPSITGLTSSTINNITAFKRRLWFVVNNSLTPWYLPLDSISGAATSFPLAPQFKAGGKLLAIGSWTLDSGEGPEDYVAFVTTEGEVALFQGVDPAVDFLLIGVFRIPKPIGKRCLEKLGGELLILTEQGVFPMSKALGLSRIRADIALTYHISNQFTDVAEGRALSGWEMELYSESNLLIVNVPLTSGTKHQYVMNTLTGAWCRFTDHEANCWAVFDNKIFYGTNGKTVRALAGDSDFGNNIESVVATAFKQLGGMPVNGHVKLVRPHLTVSKSIEIALAVLTDFNLTLDFQTSELGIVTQGGKWNVALWNQALWAGSSFNTLEWKTVFANPGFVMAHGLRVRAKGTEIRLSAFDTLYELTHGGVL